MGCSKNYIMYWGVFTVIIIPWYYEKVCTNLIFFQGFFYSLFHRYSPHVSLHFGILYNFPVGSLIIFRMEQCRKLFVADFFFFHQQLGPALKYILVLFNNCFRFFVTLIYNSFYFPVNSGCGNLADSPCMRKISSDKYFTLIITVGYHSHSG